MYNPIQHVVRTAKLLLSDQTAGVAQVQVQHNAFETAQNVPMFQQYGFVSNPPIGSTVTTLSLAGDNTSKLVIASNNASVRLANVVVGGAAIHDNMNAAVVVANGQIQFVVGGSIVAFIDAMGLHMNMATNVALSSGDVTFNGVSGYREHHHDLGSSATTVPL